MALTRNKSLIPDYPGGTGTGGTPAGVKWPDTNESTSLLRYEYFDVGTGARVRARKKGGKDTEARQQMVAGAGSLIPVVYGEQRLGGKIIAWGILSGKLVLALLWCEGEIDAVVSYTINDESAPAGTVATHYLGTDAQGVDPTLLALRTSQGAAFSDTYAGFAYSVFSVPVGKSTGFPRIAAVIRGMKVRATEAGARAYSDTNAYIIADFIESDDYGMGESVDWDSVAAVAAINVESVGSPAEQRNKLSIVLDSAMLAEEWLDLLCDYSQCWWVRDSGKIKLIPDAPGSTEFSFDESSIVAGSVAIEQRGAQNSPTVVQVVWTDRSQLPWRDEVAIAYAPGVLAGTVDRRVSRLNKPGITRYSEAMRYATQRLNEFLLSDLIFSGVLFDDAIELLPGSLIEVTHPLGLTAKKLRVMQANVQSPGRWAVTAIEYDPAKYSDTVVDQPTYPDTILPSALNPPDVDNFAVEEEIVQVQTGRFISRLRFTWDGPTRDEYVYLSGFSLQISDGTNTQSFELPFDALSFTTDALPENVNYECSIRANSALEDGSPAVVFITNNGKLALPGDVPLVAAYSVDGESRVEWGHAWDHDLTGYELRWSNQSGTWEDATFLAFVAAPAHGYQSKLIPAGDRRVWIKALDSVRTAEYPHGQESANAIYADFVVVPNSTSNSVEHELEVGTLTNMIAHPDGGWITSFGSDTFAALFPSALSSYADAIASYHAAGTSSVVSATVDCDEAEPCTVSVDPDYVDISGTGQVYIEHKVDVGDSWTRVNGSAASVNARYFRVGIEWTGSETGRVYSLGVMVRTVDATETFVRDTVLNDAIAWLSF